MNCKLTKSSLTAMSVVMINNEVAWTRYGGIGSSDVWVYTGLFGLLFKISPRISRKIELSGVFSKRSNVTSWCLEGSLTFCWDISELIYEGIELTSAFSPILDLSAFFESLRDNLTSIDVRTKHLIAYIFTECLRSNKNFWFQHLLNRCFVYHPICIDLKFVWNV